jgi:hypothetical protein
MPLERHLYDVAIATPDGVAEHRVAVTSGDRLRAEFEASKQRLPDVKKAPQNHTAVWLWCALVREGLVTVAYQEFVADVLVEFDVAKDAAGEPIKELVGPTMPALSGSHSASPLTTVEVPATG